MFSLANMFHFFADKFARLSRRRLSFSLVFTSPFECLLFWHSTKSFAAKASVALVIGAELDIFTGCGIGF